MPIFDLISNTVEGAAQVAVNTAKLAGTVVVASVVPLPPVIDAALDACEGVGDGARKIGDAGDTEGTRS